MALIDHIDGPNRLIYLSADTVGASIHPIDIYKEIRTLRATDEDLRKYDLFMSASGFEPKGGGKYTERIAKLLYGAKIVPYDTSHELTIIGTLLTDAGTSGIDCFNRTPLSPSTGVDINYIPPQVEVVTLEVSQIAYSLELNGRVYLDVNNGSDSGDHLATIARPVKTLNRALVICNEQNISTIMLAGTLVLDQAVDGKEFISWKNGKIDFNNQSCVATRFRELKLFGIQHASLALIFDCRIDNVTNLRGVLQDCKFVNTSIVVGAELNMYNCKSQTQGAPIVFDVANGSDIHSKDFTGNIDIINSVDATNQIQMTFFAGMVDFNATNVAGVAVVSGHARITDTSGPSMVIVDGTSATVDGMTEEALHAGLDTYKVDVGGLATSAEVNNASIRRI